MKQINNDIQESYCSFEVSKLLKEKGFLVGVQNGKFTNFKGSEINLNVLCWKEKLIEKYLSEDYYVLSTHTIAIEWIRVNFGIWIQPFQHYIKYSWDARWIEYKGHHNVIICNGRTFHPECYDSPQEATEAALLYTLQNLI